MTVLLAEPFKSEILARQTLGRTRDSNTMYIECVDVGFKYTKKYYYAKLPVFNKYASDVSDSTIGISELERKAYLLQEANREAVVTSPIALYDSRFDIGYIDENARPDGEPYCPLEFFSDPNSTTDLRYFHK